MRLPGRQIVKKKAELLPGAVDTA